ncbi:hypothetical protein AMS57_06855 [Pseudoalteromonas undina]|jgi:hypothetical protein|uniref:hypothetical protein n=1 Tax=Pseudoalteromonas undina TaxID=43660 RepID=UPI0006BA921E|nr:hypothetical protein [Pseudoalteromonas undina]KPH91798.1 hypothetical protein AMS57_06855 [Pseudoalteromonas undina]|tara:strand:- start:181 stop:456 length:276 start_codon:yes stop_codon:yes gene_type:complete
MIINYLKLYACLTLAGLTVWIIDQAWNMYQLKLIADVTTKTLSQVSQPKKIQVPAYKPNYQKTLTRQERKKKLKIQALLDLKTVTYDNYYK